MTALSHSSSRLAPRVTHRAQEARNAALLPGRVAPQRVLAAEARAEGSLLKGVVDLRRGQNGAKRRREVGSRTAAAPLHQQQQQQQ